MYVRDARNREEVWLLDHIEAMGLDHRAFRSRDYVVAIDETTDTQAGFGRIRIHQDSGGDECCELTSIGVLDGWRRQGVGAHIIERLIEYAGDAGFDTVYALVPVPDYFAQFGFTPIDDASLPTPLVDRLADKRKRHDDPVVPMRIAVDRFRMPERLRERFKLAGEQRAPPEPDREQDETAALAEELGIDPDEATYKYDPAGSRR